MEDYTDIINKSQISMLEDSIQKIEDCRNFMLNSKKHLAETENFSSLPESIDFVNNILLFNIAELNKERLSLIIKNEVKVT